MNLKRISTAAATGALTLGLVLGAPMSAEAKVAAKNVPTKAQIVKVFPGLSDGTFETAKTKTITVPGKNCGTPGTQKVKSAFTNTGVAGSMVVVAGAAEFKNVSKAKAFMKKYKTFVKKCKSFTGPMDSKITVKKVKTPKLGQDRIGVLQTTTIKIGNTTTTTNSSSILVRKGKKIAEVAAIDPSNTSTQVKKLAKVATKKI